jgi:hypothetical protein
MSKFSAAERDSILSESRRLIANGNAAAIRRQIDETALAWRTRERQEPRIVHKTNERAMVEPEPKPEREPVAQSVASSEQPVVGMGRCAHTILSR